MKKLICIILCLMMLILCAACGSDDSKSAESTEAATEAMIYPVSASGVPFSAATFQSTGDAITDLHEDLAAEQKARTTYDNILRLADDPDVRDVIRFLREREIVHYQRFGEGLRLIQDQLSRYSPYPENPYATNTSFDPMPGRPQPRPRKR